MDDKIIPTQVNTNCASSAVIVRQAGSHDTVSPDDLVAITRFKFRPGAVTTVTTESGHP